MDENLIKSLFEAFIKALNERDFRGVVKSFHPKLMYCPFPFPPHRKTLLGHEALMNHSINLIAESGDSFKGKIEGIYTRPNGDTIVHWEYSYTQVLGKKKVEGVECAVINLRDNLITYYAPIRQELIH